MYDDGEDDEWEDGDEDDSRSHGRCPCFILVEFGKFGSLSHQCFLTNLFPEFISVKKPNIWGDKKESEEKRKKEVCKEKAEISHIFKWLFWLK